MDQPKRTRLDLQAILEELLGSKHVYFQPPESIKMSYPAIVYNVARLSNTFADNFIYNQVTVYEITVIDQDPDNVLYKKVSRLPYCSFDRHFRSNNLNHYVFKLYFLEGAC